MFGEVAKLAVDLSLQGNFTSGIGNAQRALGTFNQSVGKIGTGVGQVAGGLGKLGLIAGGVLAVGVGAAAKQAIAFEDAFAGVKKTVDETELTKAGLSFDSLAKSFRKMSTEIPIAATEFARIGETAGALGIKATDIETFTKTVALLGVTTNLTSDAAAESLGKIGTILGLTGDDFENFADSLVALGNKGASTETEIIEMTKRFAAAGQAAGLTTDQILAFSSATASAGVEAEAGGTALSRLFSDLVKETALASDAGKAFAEISGKSFKDFSKIVKDDTVGAMLLFLDNLKELDKFEQELALGAVGITGQRERNAVRLLAESYDRNLIPALKTAAEAEGALSEEAQKRFDTLASKLTLLKTNAQEAALVVGEGLTPAIGRAADKLKLFLQDPKNLASLKTLGQDIGKFIDGIDWKGLLDNAKIAVGVITTGFKTVSAFLAPIPDQVKAIGAALLIAFNSPILGGALKSITSGIGNIVAGVGGILARGVAAKIPGVGALFAQPVYVVNMPLGGLGGAGGVAGAAGGSLLGKLIKGGIAVTIVGATAAAAVELSGILDPRHRNAQGDVFRGTNVASEQLANQERAAERLRERIAGGERGVVEKQLKAVEAEIAKLRGDVQTQTGVIKTGGKSPDERQALAVAAAAAVAAATFGTHATASGAFGGSQLAQFRGGDMSLLDERIRYLAGAQGSGAGSQGFLDLVGRDIAALKTELPRASGEDADRIRAGIDILSGILEAKKFEVSPALLEAGKDPSRERTEGEKATALMETLPGRFTQSADKTKQAIDTTRGAIDYARTTQATKTDSVRSAIDRMRADVVAAIGAIVIPSGFTVSARDVTGAQNTRDTYNSPTTLNRGGAMVPS